MKVKVRNLQFRTSVSPTLDETIANLPRYNGPAWRAESGFHHNHRTLASEVLEYEAKNGQEWPKQIPREVQYALAWYSAEFLVWVTREEATARLFGNPSRYALSHNARVIYEGKEGVLVFDPICKVNVPFVSPPTPC